MSGSTEDAAMGPWVYCCAHLRPHVVGWCTVPMSEKIRLGTTDANSGVVYAECRALGLRLRGEPTPWDWQAQRDLAMLLNGRHYRSWQVSDYARRDALILRLQACVGKQNG